MSSFTRSDENGQADGSSIVGTWVLIHSVGGGEATSAEDLSDVTLTFANGRCDVRRVGVLIRQDRYSADSRPIPCELEMIAYSRPLGETYPQQSSDSKELPPNAAYGM